MKTTGVEDIPKFGLLVFLGHPTAHDPQRSETPTHIFFTKLATLLNPLSNQNRAQVAMETHCFGGIAGESYFNRTPLLTAQNKETSRT